MNVLQVNKFYYPEIGGIENVVQNIVEGLPERYTTRVLASRPWGFGGNELHNGVKITKVSSLGTFQSVPFAPTFPLRLQKMSKNVDIIHHHLPNPLSTVSQLAIGFEDTAVVATYHSDIIRQATALKLYQPFLEKFLDSVDRILVTSEPFLHHSSILRPYRKKCDIVPLSVDLDAIDYEDSKPLDFDTSSQVILFVGRLNYYKGVKYLIEAMEQIEASLLIVGDGERRAKLERQAREHDVNDQVYFMGRVSEKNLGSTYHAADLFVLPSVEPSEAFGIVQLEAMAREVPVVNTSLPTGVPWISQDGETGRTVQPRDANELAEVINELLSNDSRRRQYGKKARDRVEKLFTRERMIDNIQDIYKKIN